MTEALFSELWPRIRESARHSENRQAAIAYLTQGRYLPLRKGDELVVRASDDAIKSGQTSAEVLEKLHRRGVRVFSSPHLHAKVVILDSVAFVSSGNLSQSSTNRNLIEAGICTDLPTVLSQLRAFFEYLKRKSTLLTESAIQRLLTLPVRPPRRSSSPLNEFNFKPGNSTWLANCYESDEELTPDEHEVLNKNLADARKRLSKLSNPVQEVWLPSGIRLAKKVQPGDSIIWITRDHWRTKVPYWVDRPMPVLSVVRKGRYVLLLLEAPRNAVKLALSWTTFKNSFPWKRLRLNPSVRTERVLTPTQCKAIDSVWNTLIK